MKIRIFWMKEREINISSKKLLIIFGAVWFIAVLGIFIGMTRPFFPKQINQNSIPTVTGTFLILNGVVLLTYTYHYSLNVFKLQTWKLIGFSFLKFVILVFETCIGLYIGETIISPPNYPNILLPTVLVLNAFMSFLFLQRMKKWINKMRTEINHRI